MTASAKTTLFRTHIFAERVDARQIPRVIERGVSVRALFPLGGHVHMALRAVFGFRKALYLARDRVCFEPSRLGRGERDSDIVVCGDSAARHRRLLSARVEPGERHREHDQHAETEQRFSVWRHQAQRVTKI